ncbi:MAG: hypothetical protein RLZ06_804, partial [Actinomycetota bacterium]
MVFGKKEPELPSIDAETLHRVSNGSHHSPHSVLGAHAADGGWVIRTLKPLATKVAVELDGGIQHELEHLENGIFHGFIKTKKAPDYRIVATYLQNGELVDWRTDDAYHYLPTLGEVDIHLIAEGRHEELWKAL